MTQSLNKNSFKNKKIESVKMKLDEWGLWERSGNSLGFLGCKSQLGVIIDDNLGQSHSSGFNDEECESTHRIYLNLRDFDIKKADCIYNYYVKSKSTKECVEILGINRATFLKRLEAGELYFAGQFNYAENTMTGKRRESESFYDYRLRQKEDKAELKEFLKGRLIWDSMKQGTLVRGKS